jgi:VWFA-related protein
MRPRTASLALLLLAFVLGTGTSPSAAGDKTPQLREQYVKWLDEVGPLLSRSERRAFLALQHDYQRDGFIRRFWESRDPYPETTRNEFQIEYERRLDEARKEYGNIHEDRARTLLMQGPADSLRKEECGLVLWPLEIWKYESRRGSGRRLGGFTLIFYQPSAGGPYRLWRYSDGFQELQALFDSTEAMVQNDYREFYLYIQHTCGPVADDILAAVDAVRVAEEFHVVDLVFQPTPARDNEWLETFRAFSTDVAASAEKLAAEVKVAFPAREGGRTVVQTLLLVPTAGVTPLVLGERKSYTFVLTGEVLREEVLFESFRYRFDLPIGADDTDTLPLAFDRLLRPGDYTLILRLEDQQSQRIFREERALAVPADVAPAPVSPEVAAALAGARADLAAASTPPEAGAPSHTLRLLPLGDDLQTGPVRLSAVATGEGIARVGFFLDGKTALQKGRPPYEVELNLGTLPRAHELRAVAYDKAGAELATATMEINAPAQRFTVTLLEPGPGQYRSTLPARAEIAVPDGAELDRLELYLNEDRVATLYQPPWAQAIPLPKGAGAGYVRAVAVLVDGLTTEDLALFNAPEAQAEVEVRLIELYAAVHDPAGRPVAGIAASEFRVLEDGVEQDILRVEPVRDLPIHLVLALDTSASMAKSLVEVQRAALLLLDRTITAKDRAALVTFSDSPSLAVKFTNDLPELSTALAGLNAERGTALYDALVFGLTYLRGVRGAQALVLLSDGSDRASKLSFDEALEYAKRSGVAVYTIGVEIGVANLSARSKLCKFAEDTGGSCHFIEAATELQAVYAQIESELRSRYLLVYQPARGTETGEFRRVEVEVAGAGREVKAIRGYYP